MTISIARAVVASGRRATDKAANRSMKKPNAPSDVWKRGAKANARYYSNLGHLAAGIGESLVSSVRPQFHAERMLAKKVLLLEGKLGSQAQGFFVIENKLAGDVLAIVEFSPLAGPADRLITPDFALESCSIPLAPGEQVVVRVKMRISRTFAPNVRYQGEIRIAGVPGAWIPMVIQRKTAARRRVRRAVRP